MTESFEIKCKKCGSTAINIHGTAISYGAKIRIKLICPNCNIEKEMPVTSVHISAFANKT